ncbi:hypothetical protein [Microbulbifer sp. SAOS-129_SWC]|uniref:hypothetical protein n=1 Tax=Microbulbifer sp. SAOS-129_SWC TaxID=3145235 RepID=UPI003217E8EF
MKLQIVKCRCGSCGFEFNVPQIRSGSYGEFLLRGKSINSVAYLDAMGDKTYDEVDRLIKSDSRMSGKSANVLAGVLRKSYGSIACDSDSEGSVFQIGAFPACPSCGLQSVDYWEVVEPPEFIDIEVPPVTHMVWQSLSESEKKQKVGQVLSSLGY